MGQSRDCGTCMACEERTCMWRSGLFEEQHRPDILGAVFLKKYEKTVEVKTLIPMGTLPTMAIPCIDHLAQTMLVIIPEEERLLGPFHLVMEYVTKYRGYGADAK